MGFERSGQSMQLATLSLSEDIPAARGLPPVAAEGFMDRSMPKPSKAKPQTDDVTDETLVERCLAGDQQAWATLVSRYKSLIYSFPRRYGANAADSADVFQAVCSELFTALSTLRNSRCLRSWIMTVAAHQSFQWKRRHITRAQKEAGMRYEVTVGPDAAIHIERAEREQLVREAIAKLPPRCQEVVKLLFYSDPPTPYAEVAQKLNMACGSVCFIRARCLRKLERILEHSGVRD